MNLHVHRRTWNSIRSMPTGFTLVEVMIALILLALLTSIIVPRLAGQDERRADKFVRELQDVLTVFAFRDSTSATQCCLWLNPSDRSIRIYNKVTDENAPEDPPSWQPDRFTAPVFIPANVSLLDTRLDGDSIGTEEWQIVSIPGTTRPAIEIDVQGPVSWTTVALEPFSITASKVGEGDRYAARTVFDLDAAGRDQEDW